MSLVCAFLTVYLVVLFARVVLSWFPVREGTVMAQVSTMLYEVTEPVIAPVRRVIPPAGMFDLSFLVVSFGVIILRSILCG
ncbi:MAG: YggT family protein [Acidimicrobiia bacterium]|nr:YggT family protein [Acidimicrobiia bacterium]